MAMLEEDAPAGADEAQSTTEWALFRAGGARLAVAAERTHRFVYVGSTVPVPLAPPSVLGVANAGGKLVTVLDVALVLGLPATRAAGERVPCVVVRYDDELVGLAADSLDGLAEVPAAAVRGAGEDSRGTAAGIFSFGGHLVTVLDVDRLVSTIETALGRT
jgi:purine-binding chemotaxis protein CheW